MPEVEDVLLRPPGKVWPRRADHAEPGRFEELPRSGGTGTVVLGERIPGRLGDDNPAGHGVEGQSADTRELMQVHGPAGPPAADKVPTDRDEERTGDHRDHDAPPQFAKLGPIGERSRRRPRRWLATRAHAALRLAACGLAAGSASLPGDDIRFGHGPDLWINSEFNKAMVNAAADRLSMRVETEPCFDVVVGQRYPCLDARCYAMRD